MNINPLEAVKRGYVYAPEQFPIITDFTHKECQISSNGVDLRIAYDYAIDMGEQKNVEILERFNMPGVFGMLWIRSSFSRKGIFMSCGLFDDGFCGVGGVTLYNHGNEDICIKAGTRICQIVFLPSNPAKSYDGHYNKNQTIVSQFDKPAGMEGDVDAANYGGH